MVVEQRAGSRVEWLDLARGFGIILVVYGHVLHSFFSRDMIDVAGYFYWSERVVYSFHMPLFFFISGCFFIGQIEKYKARAIVLKRLDTILYPYLIWSVIQGLVEVFASQYGPEQVTVKEVLLSLFVQPRAHFWFLYYLFIMNVVTVYAAKLFNRPGLIILLIYSLVIFSVQENVHGFSGNFIFFLIGALVGSRVFMMEKIQGAGYVLAIIAVLFFGGTYIILRTEVFSWGVLRFYMAVSGIMLTLLFSCYLKNMKNKIVHYVTGSLVQLGKGALFIYLVHVLAYQVFLVAMKTLHIQNTVVNVLGGTLVGLIGPYILFEIVNRLHIEQLYRSNLSAFFGTRSM